MLTFSRYLFLVVTLSFTILSHLVVSPSLQAGEQAQRAIQGVRQLIAEGAIPADATLKIVVKQGNIRNYWGQNFSLKNQWEEQTGILVDANVMPQMPALDLLSTNADFDFTIARQREYPDLYSRGLILDLTPYVKKYGLHLEEDSLHGFISPKAQSEFADRIVAIPADGDIAVLYLRRDLLEDPANQAEFKKRYNRDLTPPETWEEYLDQLRFFHSPEREFYGSCEERDLHTGWMFWMLRYTSQASPYQYLFDDEMRPLINSPQGIRATEQYIATIPFSPPEALKEGHNYSYTLPFYKKGQGYAFILTMSAAKIFNSPQSVLKDRFIVTRIPGNYINETLVRRSSFIYGNNIVISAKSKHPELAFLYAMWLSDPDISADSVMVSGGYADPFRHNHITNEAMQEIYTRQALETLVQQARETIPAGTGLPGDSEYIEALNMNIWLAGKNEITPAEAMARTADEWERITEKYGREKQKSYWRSFIRKYPETQPEP